MSKISPHEEKMINLQHQMQQNNSDLQKYLSGLDDWTSEIKEKESKIKDQGTSGKKDDLPPVRNTIEKKKLKKKKKEKKIDPNKPKKLSGFDFRAWDKFDVDKALEEIDESDKKAETSSSDYETDEEWELERKKHLAELEKDKGNKFLKNGDIERAVEAYTKGMEFDSTNSILPANRALALIKQQKFAAAELDCTSSIVLDPLYVKAYLRRATARAGLSKVEDALSDYRRVLDLEPANRQAKAEVDRLEKDLLREKDGPVKSSFTEGQNGVVKPVHKSLEDRSKAPMKRIVIEEIGVEASSRPQRSSAAQSEVAQKITAKEGEAFDSLFKSPQSNSLLSEADATHVHPPQETVRVDPKVMAGGSDHKDIQAISSKNIISESCNSQQDSNPNLSDDQRNKPDSKTSQDEQTAPQKTRLSSRREESATEPHQTPKPVKDDCTKQEPSASNLSNGTGGDGLRFQVPQSSFQFQADFKLLKKKPEAFQQYFQAIPPSHYPRLFGQCLDADILNAVLRSLTFCSTNSKVDLFDILYNLTLVKRFSMTAMFLSSKDKKVVEDLLQCVSKSGQRTEEEVANLRQKYQL